MATCPRRCFLAPGADGDGAAAAAPCQASLDDRPEWRAGSTSGLQGPGRRPQLVAAEQPSGIVLRIPEAVCSQSIPASLPKRYTYDDASDPKWAPLLQRFVNGLPQVLLTAGVEALAWPSHHRERQPSAPSPTPLLTIAPACLRQPHPAPASHTPPAAASPTPDLLPPWRLPHPLDRGLHLGHNCRGRLRHLQVGPAPLASWVDWARAFNGFVAPATKRRTPGRA
jgi:hypothetical protein